MPPRHPSKPRALPRQWLMTDERIGEALWAALVALPKGSGIVFRHHATPHTERRALYARVARIARARRLVLVRAGPRKLGREDGVHGAARRISGGFRTWPAHSVREASAGRRAGADLLFVSPIFPTRSHPGARTLGPLAAMRIARAGRLPAIALGGMNARRFDRLTGFYGWAAIDAWVGG